MRTPVRAFLVMAALLSMAPPHIPSANADPCPDVDVVFARGTEEPPGIGRIGRSFVDSLQSDLAGKAVGVYAVNYPASKNWPTAAEGVADAGSHIRDMVANCPNTKLVIGGYSQGASVTSLVTDDVLPPFFAPPFGALGQLPGFVSDHIAAVALFGTPSPPFLNSVGAPPIAPGPLYVAKVINMCLPEDPVCSPTGTNGVAHTAYADNGMTAAAAAIAAQRLG